MFDITKFKANGDRRDWMNKLFDVNGFLGAANGHYIVLDTNSKSKFYGFPKFENLINPKNNGKIQRQLLYIINTPEMFNWQEIPNIPSESYRECYECNPNGKERVRGDSCVECDGDGELEFESDYNDYTVDCKSCEGNGNQLIGWQTCSLCNGTKKHLMFVPLICEGLGNDKWDFNSEYVRKFSELGGCKVAWVEDWELFVIKFDGGVALVMPMRK